MVKYAYILLILAVAVDINAQFFDFFSAFKPPTLRPIFEPTKSPRLRNYATTERYQENDRMKPIEHTTKYIRKTTKTSKQSNKKSKIDNIIDDGRNTIIFDNPRSKAYTEHPFSRPGVKPAIVDGPPITNKPPPKPYVSRPVAGLGQNDDGSVTPELIIGPDEDYMSSVEKQRYIDMAEKKCEQYISLSTVRVEAIPLVPSPSPVVVNVSSCSWSIPLVVGGNTVTIQQFPHMALLGWKRVQSSGYSWKCGGSLVSERHVLTAAHCAYQERDDTVMIGPPRAVQLGSSQLDDPGAIVQHVSSVTRHPKYRPPQSYHDIAVVTMTTAVTFSSAIRPACMGAPPAPGEHFIATGWGKTEFGGDQSSQLRGVSLTVWSQADCAAALENTRKLPRGPDESQTCAGERDGGKDTCQGDSGGPAQVLSHCSWRVLAVTSAGRSCGAPGTPALYANIPLAFVAKVVYGRIDHDGQPNSNNNQNTNSNKKQNDFSPQNSDSSGQQSSYNNENSNSNNRQNYYNRQNNNNRENDNNRQNSNKKENDYNRQSSNNRENDYTKQNDNNREIDSNEPNGNNRKNDYDRQSSYNRENDYNRQNSNNRENDYNRQNSNNRGNDYNRQNSNNRENDYNRQNSNNRGNDYNRQNSNNRENNYNRQNSNNRGNDYNRQNSNNRENDYNGQNSNNRGNDYNRQNSNNRENDYNGQNSNNRGNDYNRQNSNNRGNDYNRQNSNNRENDNNQQNSNNQQSQWNKRTTTTPRWNQNQQSYNSGWNSNYNNPSYMGNTDGRYRRTDEYSTSRPQYHYPSLDHPYSDGNIWWT